VAYRVVLLLLLALAALLQPAPRPASAFEMKLCEYCRRQWDNSPSRIRAVADANGREKGIVVCSPFCLAMVLKKKPHYELASTTIVAWDDRAKLDAGMVNVNSAKLLIEVRDTDDFSHDPDVAAFRSDKALAAGKKTAGGKSITWDDLLAKVTKLAAETDDTRESTYQPKHHRQY
jgi:hypothetical protein